jgi:hypothetical protein
VPHVLYSEKVVTLRDRRRMLDDAEVAAILQRPHPDEALAAEEAALVADIRALHATAAALRTETHTLHEGSHSLRLLLAVDDIAPPVLRPPPRLPL